MISRLDPPLVAGNGRRLQVLGIARISTEHQDTLSLNDQEQLYWSWLNQHTDLLFDMHCIAGQGSGECLDRAESFEAAAAIESGKYDLVITEDLGRIFRRMQAYIFCETCEDFNTRLIAINDYVDTSREDWRLTAFFAAMRHEAYNQDTGKRIRRTLRNRFQQGGVFQCNLYGYVKPPDAKSDSDVHKDPDAEPVYEAIFQKLEAGESFAEIADWLNERQVPVGPYCRTEQWDGMMVGRIVRNPILKGVRVRNDRMSKRINKTGHRKSIKAPPDERLERSCPHLAFIEPGRYDHVMRMLDERNSKYRRKGENGRDTRHNVPKKRTRFPGQLIDCGVCGRNFVFGGHGKTDHLMCNGARAHECWNGITVNGPLAAERISQAVSDEIETIPGFDDALLEAVQEEAKGLDESRLQASAQLAQKERRLDGQINNLLTFITDGDSSDRVRQKLRELEQELSQIKYDRQQLDQQPQHEIVIPDMNEICRLWQESVEEMAIDSWEFSKLMRKLISRIVVFPYRLCDGGHIVLRAQFRVRLANLLPDQRMQDVLQESWEKVLTVDLFDPPQRELYRKRIVELRETATEREVAQQIGITQTAAQRGAALQRQMDSLQLTDPYVAVAEPPDDYGKLTRHLNSRYRFKPLSNAGQL